MKMRVNLKAILLSLTITAVVITCAVYMRCADHFTFAHHLVGHWDRRLYAVQSGLEVHEGNHNDNGLSNNMIESDETSETVGAIDYGPNSLQDIDCIINQEYSIHCKHDATTHEVYVPFSFLRHYFDVLGTLTSSTGDGAVPVPFSLHESLMSSSISSASHVLSSLHSVSSTARIIDKMDTISHQPEVAPAVPHTNHIKFLWMHSSGKINPPKAKYDARGVFMYFENYNVEVKCVINYLYRDIIYILKCNR